MVKVFLFGGSKTSLLIFLRLLWFSVASSPVDVLEVDIVFGFLHHIVRREEY